MSKFDSLVNVLIEGLGDYASKNSAFRDSRDAARRAFRNNRDAARQSLNASRNSAMDIVDDLRSPEGREQTAREAQAVIDTREYMGANPAENNEGRRKFRQMFGDPSKRPQFGAQKANELEQKYEQGMASIVDKYKDFERPDYGELIENRYRYTQDMYENFFHGVTDDLRAGDKHAWDKMVAGDTSRGIYTDVAEVGHHDMSFELTASETMRKMLKLANAYYGGDVKQLSYLLGLTPNDSF
jgi:hypothetical protein